MQDSTATTEAWGRPSAFPAHAGARAATSRGVHPTAIVERGAELGDGVEVGPRAIVQSNARLGDGVRVGAGAIVTGFVRIGPGTRIWPGAIVGEEPQDRSYRGAPSFVEIGPDCMIREYVTVHRGTEEGSVTRIGSGCLLMACSHVAHNCRLDDRATIVNGALLAGFVTVGEAAIVSGNALVHQFVRIGAGAMIRGGARAARDVPPYHMLVENARIAGLNWVGLRRAGVSEASRRELRDVYRILHDEELPFADRVGRIVALAKTDEGRTIAEFLRQPSRRGYCHC